MTVADKFAEAYPHLDVGISQFACSGAGTLRNSSVPKSGVTMPKGSYSQISALENAVRQSGRKPDYLLLSIGGNDLRFAPLLSLCLGNYCDEAVDALEGRAISVLGPFSEFAEKAQHVGRTPEDILSEAYQGLDRRFEASIDGGVYLASYYLPTRNEKGELEADRIEAAITDDGCEYKRLPGADEHDLLGNLVGMFLSYGVWNYTNLGVMDEAFRTAEQKIILRITNAQRRSKPRDWLFEPQLALDVFARGGIAATSAYRRVNSVCDSLREQGDYNGGFHPNRRGHIAYGEAVFRYLSGQQVFTRIANKYAQDAFGPYPSYYPQ